MMAFSFHTSFLKEFMSSLSGVLLGDIPLKEFLLHGRMM